MWNEIFFIIIEVGHLAQFKGGMDVLAQYEKE